MKYEKIIWSESRRINGKEYVVERLEKLTNTGEWTNAGYKVKLGSKVVHHDKYPTDSDLIQLLD